MNRLEVASWPRAFAIALAWVKPATAATLTPITDWNSAGIRSNVAMNLYVPDVHPAHPAVVVLAHYCGGTASAVFGQATGGGLVDAVNRNGHLLVVPEAKNSDGTGRCWDVGSTAALTSNGGGDTDAIVRMVNYTLTKYGANAERVYVTGDSSGGMMTQALLALYPEVFKAGSAFAGVPAGCWAVDNPGGGWSGPCAGGTVQRTATEWGSLVRGFQPGYSGHRPRVQLVHGDADSIINYQNHLESIKQWTNVLGVPESPTSTDTVPLGNHQATRRRWVNECGYVVLEAYQSLGGDHGPSDALFAGKYVTPFLALDDTGAVDPEIKRCNSGPTGGTSSTGGTSATAGVSSTGGYAGLGGSSNGPIGGKSSNSGGLSAIGGSYRAATGTGGSPVTSTVVSTSRGIAGSTSVETSPTAADGCSCRMVGQTRTVGFLGNRAGASFLVVAAAWLRRRRRTSARLSLR